MRWLVPFMMNRTAVPSAQNFPMTSFSGDVVARLRTHRAELVGEIVRHGDSYRVCYVCGPRGWHPGAP